MEHVNDVGAGVDGLRRHIIVSRCPLNNTFILNSELVFKKLFYNIYIFSPR